MEQIQLLERSCIDLGGEWKKRLEKADDSFYIVYVCKLPTFETFVNYAMLLSAVQVPPDEKVIAEVEHDDQLLEVIKSAYSFKLRIETEKIVRSKDIEQPEKGTVIYKALSKKLKYVLEEEIPPDQLQQKLNEMLEAAKQYLAKVTA